MSRRAWITPDNTPSGNTCWRVFCPNDLFFEAALRGALLELQQAHNWEQVGTLTPDECAGLWFDANFLTFPMVECGTPGGGDTVRVIGEVFWLAGDSSPDNAVLCDGQSYSTALYPALFAEIGYAWGGSDTLFNVPDLFNLFVVGAGDIYSLGDTGGESEHELTVAEMPTHHHGLRKAAAVGATLDVITQGKYAATDIATFDTGDGDAHNNLPPYAALVPWIFVGE